MREPCSTSTAVGNRRGTRSTLRSYWSVQIHATRKQLTAHEREGAYIVKRIKIEMTRTLTFTSFISRFVSKDDGGKVGMWLHSHVKWLYSAIKSIVL